MKRKVPIVEQLQQTECGLCCVAMILGYYGCHVGLGQLRQCYEVGRDGIKISEMKNLLEIFGTVAKVYKTSFEVLKNNNCPCIVYWENKHYVVIEEIDIVHNKVRLVDPANGRRVVCYEEAKKNFSEYVILAMPSDNFQKVKKKPNVWLKYIYLIWKNKSQFFSILFLAIISYIFTLLIPVAIQMVVDKVSVGGGKELFGNPLNWLTILGLLLVYIIATYLSGVRKISFAKYIDKEIAEKLFSHLLKLPVKFFELRSQGDILFRIQSLSIIRDMFTQKIVAFLMNCGTEIVMLIYLFYLSPIISVIALLAFVLSGIAITYTRRRILETNQSEISETSRLQTIQSEMVYSIINIKMTGTEENIYNKWNNQFLISLDKHAETMRYNNIHNTLIYVLNQIGPLVMLALSIWQHINGKISIGEVMALYSAGTTFMSVCVSIFTSVDDFLLSSQYLERINEIMVEKEEKYLEDGMDVICDGSIELRDVAFSFTNHSAVVLDNISLKIEPGQKVAFVGASGAGKSTLGKVLLGIYEPTKGEILYNGIQLNKLNRKALRRQMGVVPQEVILLNDSIYNNIEMFRNEVTKEKVESAAEIAQVKNEIEEMPMKYNTVVSDMGNNISGGQRQRIGFARAIVNTPRILVLDEATSSLDTINEGKISQHLKNMGCTRVVIAHRISTIIDSDVIYVMKEGKIVECGSHEYLMRLNGVYKQLYENQVIEDI